jgi:hypothetical protein
MMVAASRRHLLRLAARAEPDAMVTAIRLTIRGANVIADVPA